MSPCTSPSTCTSPLETRLPLIVRSGPMTEALLRSPPRGRPSVRAPMPDDCCGALGGRFGVIFGGSDSDLLKFGNIRFHLRYATNATTKPSRDRPVKMRASWRHYAADAPPRLSSSTV